ncbi:MAG: EAL domain-containing protein [Ilumatobacteraceae bacterium]
MTGRPSSHLLTAMAWAAATAAVVWLLVDDAVSSWGDTWDSTVVRAATTGVTAVVVGAVHMASARRRETRGRRRPVRPLVLILLGAVPTAALGATAAVTSGGTGGPDRSSVVVVAVFGVIAVVAVGVRLVDAAERARTAADRRGQHRAGAMVEHGSDVVLITDADGIVRYASPGLGRTLGHVPAAWLGCDVAALGAEESDQNAIRARIASVRDDASAAPATIELPAMSFEVSLSCQDGQRRHAEGVVANRLDDDAVGGIVVTFRDITEQRDLERQLSHRAFHDELTGLANRALFLDRMDHSLRLTRHGGNPVMVLFIDLDDFKEVNDQHGHGVGDEMLRVIADRIRTSASSGDTVARLGGDEFAVLLEDSGGLDRALDLAERLLAALRDPVRIGNLEVMVLASIGIAVAPVGANTTSLLREADIAMYEAKRAGKGQIRIFDPAMRRVAARQFAYRGELSHALEREQLRVVYQPYVDLASGEVRGAEALVRWHHPEHGDIPPNEFVPIAVRSGVIVQIGRWVIETALDQAVGWRSDLDLFVSVNLSAGELRQTDLIDHLVETVRARRLPTGSLVLEVTETDLMEGGDRALETVADLRRHGFRVALDDFGAGYSSISHLQQHPVDMIKIDRAFVAQLDRSGGDPTMVRAVLGLTDTLRIRSAAEGIETPEQLRELRRLGCEIGQGHLLAAPLEAPVIARRFGRSDAVPTTHA